jgi:hypothetical protein
MRSYIYQFLMSFRNVFSRYSTWLVFCMVILGFMGATEMIGVTSFCRFWSVGESGYHAFLNFFRSSAWSLEMLICCWSTFVLSQNEAVCVQGRAVLFGDHTNAPKEGRRMPCVVSLHQHSETQSKPSYFRGHYWGAIGLMIGSMVSPYCLPLALAVHQGLVHIGEKDKLENSKETSGTRIVQMALDFAARHDLPSILVLDAFFPWGCCFQAGRLSMVTKA